MDRTDARRGSNPISGSLGSEKQFSDLAAEDTGRWMAGWRWRVVSLGWLCSVVGSKDCERVCGGDTEKLEAQQPDPSTLQPGQCVKFPTLQISISACKKKSAFTVKSLEASGIGKYSSILNRRAQCCVLCLGFWHWALV